MKTFVITGITTKTGNNNIRVHGVTTDTYEQVSFITDISQYKSLENVMNTVTPITLDLQNKQG